MGFLEVPLVFYLLLCLSCSQKEEDSERELPERTVLVYMAADNNLYGSVRADIEEKEMLPAETPANGHLVVYLDAPGVVGGYLPAAVQHSSGGGYSCKAVRHRKA